MPPRWSAVDFYELDGRQQVPRQSILIINPSPGKTLIPQKSIIITGTIQQSKAEQKDTRQKEQEEDI